MIVFQGCILSLLLLLGYVVDHVRADCPNGLLQSAHGHANAVMSNNLYEKEQVHHESVEGNIHGDFVSTLFSSEWISPSVTHVNKTEIRIATFNAYWLFNETRTSMSTWPWKTREDLDVHHNRISQALSVLDSDILNMVEVSSDCTYLHNLVKAGNMSTNPNIYVVEGRDTATKQNVALLTPFTTALARSESRVQYPIPESKCGFCSCSDTLKSTGVSKHYFSLMKLHQADLDEEDWFPLLVVGVHLKAIPNDPPSCAQREGQVSVIMEETRNIINRLYEEYPNKVVSVIMMGDFNDYDSSIPDKHSNTPNSRSLELLRVSLNLTNVLNTVDQSSRYSHWWDKNDNNQIDHGEESLIDHILVSSHMIPSISQIDIFSKQLYPEGDLMTSDHWPIGFSLNISHLAQSLKSIEGKILHMCDRKTSLDPSVCSNHGVCIGNECQCTSGYTGSSCQIVACNGIAQNDRSVCSGRGICVSPDICNCTDPLYKGPNCENRTFPVCFGISSIDHPNLVCSGRGSCTADDTCKCNPNYTGTECQHPICYQIQSSNPEVCSRHGVCLAPDKCACNENWAGLLCQNHFDADVDTDSKDPEVIGNMSQAILVIFILVIVVVVLLGTLAAACFLLAHKHRQSDIKNDLSVLGINHMTDADSQEEMDEIEESDLKMLVEHQEDENDEIEQSTDISI